MPRMINPLTKDELGKKIKELRIQKGVSQSKLGEALGKSHAAVSDIENGKTELNASDLPVIANFFGVPLSDFLPEQKEVLSFPFFTQNRDSKDITPEQKKEADQASEKFLEHVRKLAQEEAK